MSYVGFDIAKENHYASIADSNGEIIQGKSHNNTVCHVAHKLTRVIFHMLKENIEFKEQLEN